MCGVTMVTNEPLNAALTCLLLLVIFIPSTVHTSKHQHFIRLDWDLKFQLNFELSRRNLFHVGVLASSVL